MRFVTSQIKDDSTQQLSKEFSKTNLKMFLPKTNRGFKITMPQLRASLPMLPTGTNLRITTEDAFKNLFKTNTTVEIKTASEETLMAELLSQQLDPICYFKYYHYGRSGF